MRAVSMMDSQTPSFGGTVAARVAAAGKPMVMVDGKQVRVERCSEACITGRNLHGDMTLINLELARAVTILKG